MLRAVIGVETVGHFEFVDRLGGDPIIENLVEPLEDVMIALEASDAFLDGKAGLHRVVHRADPGEARQVLVGAIGVHGQTRKSLAESESKYDWIFQGVQGAGD